MRRIALFLLLLPLLAALGGGLGLFLHAWFLFDRNYPRIDNELRRLAAILENRDPGAPAPKTTGEDELLDSVPLHAQSMAPSRIFDASGALVGEFARLDQRWIRETNALPTFVIPVLIATEDRDFRRHAGYSVKSILRAAVANVRRLSAVQGGSTLTQQLAKTLFTTRQKHLSRKAFELLCAREIERRFDKDSILLLYLNLAYFGHGNYGVQNAAYSYFGKPASALSLVECAHMVGILANPGIYSPRTGAGRSMRRHKVVMNLLVAQGLVGEAWAHREYDRYWVGVAGGSINRANALWPMSVNRSPYFVEWMRRDLDRMFPDETVQRGGYRIHTTLDLELQESAETVLAAGLLEVNKAFPQLAQSNRIEGALVVVDHRSGALLAAAGGSRFTLENQLLRFEQVRRPIGSLGKPFVYLLAHQNLGWTATNLIDDSPMKIRIPGRVWEPRNYDRQFLGPVSLEAALIASRNIPVLRALEAIGPGGLVTLVQGGADVETGRVPRNLSIALGSYDLSPLEVARLYSILPRGGRALKTEKIIAVEDAEGKTVIDNRALFTENTARGETLVSEEASREILAILKKVIHRPEGTAYGAARATGMDFEEVAGKTGTTQSYKDAWFAGMTRDFTAVVWLGVDENIQMESGSGGRIAAPIWMRFVKAAYGSRNPGPLETTGASSAPASNASFLPDEMPTTNMDTNASSGNRPR
ncbi:MAG: transglycosylase domain-containing protein [Spirochaetes bacterium]|nr:transglycosylase domain-containing protein [Spirochaetota bacterium]